MNLIHEAMPFPEIVVTLSKRGLALAGLRMRGSVFHASVRPPADPIDRVRRLVAALAPFTPEYSMPHTKDPQRALTHLTEFLSHHIEGPDGLAADVAKAIADFRATLPTPDAPAVTFVGRAGALYPFFRTSALLRSDTVEPTFHGEGATAYDALNQAIALHECSTMELSDAWLNGRLARIARERNPSAALDTLYAEKQLALDVLERVLARTSGYVADTRGVAVRALKALR